MHTAPDMTFWCQNKYLKEYLSSLLLPWHFSSTMVNAVLIYISLLIISCIIEYVTNKITLNLEAYPSIFIFSYIEKKIHSVDIFYPVLTCNSMETCCSCQARWRIAAAAHNLCVLISQIACQSSSLRTVNWI